MTFTPGTCVWWTPGPRFCHGAQPRKVVVLATLCNGTVVVAFADMEPFPSHVHLVPSSDLSEGRP